MASKLLPHILKESAGANMGAVTKELLLDQVEKEFGNGNHLASVFYQVRALYQVFPERFCGGYSGLFDDMEVEMNAWEEEDMKTNPLMKEVVEYLKKNECKSLTDKDSNKHKPKSSNFLQNITEPLEGISKIEEICNQLPAEWTIVQLCKGICEKTMHSTYPEIHEQDAPIYVTVLRHARSALYPSPICLRFSGAEKKQLFRKFSSVSKRFKHCVRVDAQVWNSREAKKLYWDILKDVNKSIAELLDDLKQFFYPWNFLFTGRLRFTNSNLQHENHVFKCVDEFCNTHGWEARERVLFSLAALHSNSLSIVEKYAICGTLTSNESVQNAAVKLLDKLENDIDRIKCKAELQTNCSPCILIVDERLDHFFWEELNVLQEFTRITSLQSLWCLYQLHKDRIQNGYCTVDITCGGCLINPDNNLPKMELRMRKFFEYWTPDWHIKYGQKPTQDELLNNFFKKNCYVYAGHGSGLQYLNGKHIARNDVNSVVFLFGCDSTRLHSNGLYGELVGAHLYYHEASCPALVGTILPGLDAHMDLLATEILSRWIAPTSQTVSPWDQIDHTTWSKEGLIKRKGGNQHTAAKVMADTKNYHIGSLCAILARVHQRISDTKYYNTVLYVCRGLPVWNCNVEALPKTSKG